MMLKLSVFRMEELFSLISKDTMLYLPIEKNGMLQSGKWAPGADVKLDRLNTIRSPKDFFFPQTENLAVFKMKNKNITIEENRDPAEPFALFGIRACDAASMELLDLVFLSDPVDTFYQSRRENGIIITNACLEPEETCFCQAFNIDAVEPIGDVAVWLLGYTLYWKALTKKGEDLTRKVKELFEPTDSRDLAVISEQQNKARAVFDKLPFKNISLKNFMPEALMEKFKSNQWADLNKACLACGTCTYICPTCHCYDIQDYDTGRDIRRLRCWDSCMYSDFTLMAHGNPRQTQLERFRQRYMHKLIYFPDNNGKYACTGCGRCVLKCPISMNIVKVIKALGVE